MDYSTPWRDRFEAAREALEQNLHIAQPVMQTILILWDKYRDSTLLDLSSIRWVQIGGCVNHVVRVLHFQVSWPH